MTQQQGDPQQPSDLSLNSQSVGGALGSQVTGLVRVTQKRQHLRLEGFLRLTVHS